MRLDGIDHITGITGDGQRCLDFYVGILGLAFLGRDQDFEAPDSHLIRLGLEPDRPGGILAFIEAPGIVRGRAGKGMSHQLRWSVDSSAAIEYWADRLSEAGIEVQLLEGGEDPRLRFADPEGLEHEFALELGVEGAGLAIGESAVPNEHAIARLAGVRAYGRDRVSSADILAGRLGFRATGPSSYEVGRGRCGVTFAFDPPPLERGRVGAGTIHHVAWGTDGPLPAWRQRVIGMGCRVTPLIDHGRCRSIYFREPSGTLFEIATSSETQGEAGPENPAYSHFRLSPNVDPRIRPGALA